MDLSPGPQLRLAPNSISIVEQGMTRVKGSRINDAEHVILLAAYYYVMDLSYPKSFGSVLGLIQQFIFGQKFVEATNLWQKKCKDLY